MRDLRFVFVTLTGGYDAALIEAARRLRHDHGINVQLSLHSTAMLTNPQAWDRLARDVEAADFVFGSMIFGEEYVRPMQPILEAASAPSCIITSNPALMYTTRLGKLELKPRPEGEKPGLLKQWMQRLRPRSKGKDEVHRQHAFVKNLAKFMKFVPGKMRDLHTFIVAHSYWLHSSPENLERMMCLFIDRYVPGFEGVVPVLDPIEYPDGAIYHPDAPEPFADIDSYRAWRKETGKPVGSRHWRGSVGLLTMRAIILSGNTVPIDVLIRQLEAAGIEARAAYSALLDFRPAIDDFFSTANGAKLPAVDMLVNCTGFPLVGGPAGSNPDKATEALAKWDVGLLNLIPLNFQRVEDWQADTIGLNPMQAAMNIALPELDGSIEPIIFGGPTAQSKKFVGLEPEIDLAARRIARHITLKQRDNADKKLAIVLFNFPPNLGNAGTAAFLDVFESVHRLLTELREQGYDVEIPADAEELRHRVVDGNSMQYGTTGNVGARLSLDEYRQRFPWYTEIEEFWGYAPGELLTDGNDFYILGAQFGSVFVALQPSFGYERDPMRLLMGKDAAPHHGFAAFYTWLDQVYGADAVVHFGTHGALEFMPGKQVGLGNQCWPQRLLGGLPNIYYYCVNNPSEGAIAKRRGAATLVSYMTPPLQQAGLYKGLRRLKDSIENYHKRPDAELLADIRVQAGKLGINADKQSPLNEFAEVCSSEFVTNGTNGHNGNGHNGANGHSNGHSNEFAEVRSSDFVTESTNGHSNGNGHNGNGNGSGHHAEDDAAYIAALGHELIQVEHRMIPLGLHILDKAPSEDELVDILALVVSFNSAKHPNGKTKLPTLPAMIADGLGLDYTRLTQTLKTDSKAQASWERIDDILHNTLRLFVRAPRAPQLDTREVDRYLKDTIKMSSGLLVNLWAWLDDLMQRIIHDGEIKGLIHALNGGYILPSPGNDVVRNDMVVPTGRNIHALDPYRVPTPAAMKAGTELVEQMLKRLTAENGKLPESIAMVLWGTDNLKSDGEGVAQCLALLGALPVEDELGNISDVTLIPLTELGRPRIDAVMTVSGIFRDLLHHQAGLLDKAVRLAANADEPVEFNYVRKHALAQAEELGISIDEAAARVFSNASGTYGANVNHMIESSSWENDDELSDTFLTRKSFAYGPGGEWRGARDIMERSLATVEATFQNIDSFEMGISDIDHYYEYLGGVTKSVEKMRGERPNVLVADAIALDDRISSLEQMVRLESRAKLLNPKWYESMLDHGYEGVREIETRVSNTYGWSATANAVEGWVYDDVAETFLLDAEMRARMAQANPHATAAIAKRLLEAEARGFWDATDEMIDQLRDIYGNLEDQLEGITSEA